MNKLLIALSLSLSLASSLSIANQPDNKNSPMFFMLGDNVVAGVSKIKYMAVDDYPTNIYYSPNLSLQTGKSIKELLNIIQPYPSPCVGIGCNGRINKYIIVSAYYGNDHDGILVSVDKILFIHIKDSKTRIVFGENHYIEVTQSIDEVIYLMSPNSYR